MAELFGLFAASFVAATLFPLPSEAALFAYLQAHPDNQVLAVSIATVGNTAGGMTSYLVGRLIPQKKLDLRAIDRTTVQEYQATRLAAGVTSKTVNREVSVLKSLLREAVPRHLAVNPLYGMPNLKKGRTPRKRMVRAQEERRLLAALPPDVRDLYIIAVDTLIRQANAVHLHRRECRPAHLALEDSKTGPYTVPLSTRVRAILRRRIQARTGYLFPEWHERFLANQGGWSHELNRILRRAARAAGIATDGSEGRLSWHTATRATGATRMIRAGVDPRRVQLIGNWQSLDQMAEYLELDLSGGHDAVNRIAARNRR